MWFNLGLTLVDSLDTLLIMGKLAIGLLPEAVLKGFRSMTDTLTCQGCSV